MSPPECRSPSPENTTVQTSEEPRRAGRHGTLGKSLRQPPEFDTHRKSAVNTADTRCTLVAPCGGSTREVRVRRPTAMREESRKAASEKEVEKLDSADGDRLDDDVGQGTVATIRWHNTELVNNRAALCIHNSTKDGVLSLQPRGGRNRDEKL